MKSCPIPLKLKPDDTVNVTLHDGQKPTFIVETRGMSADEIKERIFQRFAESKCKPPNRNTAFSGTPDAPTLP